MHDKHLLFSVCRCVTAPACCEPVLPALSCDMLTVWLHLWEATMITAVREQQKASPARRRQGLKASPGHSTGTVLMEENPISAGTPQPAAARTHPTARGKAQSPCTAPLLLAGLHGRAARCARFSVDWQVLLSVKQKALLLRRDLRGFLWL